MKWAAKVWLLSCAVVSSGCLAPTLGGGGGRSFGGVSVDQARKNLDVVHPLNAPPPADLPEAMRLLGPAARESAARLGSPPAQLMRVYPTVHDWETERNAYGIVTGRNARVMVFYRSGDTGYCRKEDTSLHQDEQGGRWGKPFVRLGQLGLRVECSEIDRLPGSPPA